MKKIKVYLDTNTILDFFINHIKYMKKGEELIVPKKFQFMSDSLDKINFITSFLTEGEVFRWLIAGYSIEERTVESVWKDFLKILNCKYIEEYKFDRSIVKLVSKTKMKLRTMFNFMHLFIAMSENAYFVTGDKDLIKKARELKMYDKILTYIELRKLISKLS